MKWPTIDGRRKFIKHSNTLNPILPLKNKTKWRQNGIEFFTPILILTIVATSIITINFERQETWQWKKEYDSLALKEIVIYYQVCESCKCLLDSFYFWDSEHLISRATNSQLIKYGVDFVSGINDGPIFFDAIDWSTHGRKLLILWVRKCRNANKHYLHSFLLCFASGKKLCY